MGFFKKLFTPKKEPVDITELEDLTQTGCLGDAERIASVVSSGLDSENYAELNQNLVKLTMDAEERTTFVFEHPSVIGNFYGIVICLLFVVAFLYYLFIGLCTVCFSPELRAVGAFFTVTSAAVLILNVKLIVKRISTIRFKGRFDVYEELLGYKSMEFVEDLAICSKQAPDVVVSDLRKAVKQKLIPQGHFSNENCVFMVSNSVYQRYAEKPAVYDRYFQQVIEERQRAKSRTEEISQLLETGDRYIQKLQGYVSLVKDKTLSTEIKRMENLVAMIFHEIDVSPSQAQSLGVFLNYYLPTTEKLLDAYVSIEGRKVQVANVAKTRREIETAVSTIIPAFERILEKLYEEQEMDILSDIDAVELSMKQEELLL